MELTAENLHMNNIFEALKHEMLEAIKRFRQPTARPWDLCIRRQDPKPLGYSPACDILKTLKKSFDNPIVSLSIESKVKVLTVLHAAAESQKAQCQFELNDWLEANSAGKAVATERMRIAARRTSLIVDLWLAQHDRRQYGVANQGLSGDSARAMKLVWTVRKDRVVDEGVRSLAIAQLFEQVFDQEMTCLQLQMRAPTLAMLVDSALGLMRPPQREEAVSC